MNAGIAFWGASRARWTVGAGPEGLVPVRWRRALVALAYVRTHEGWLYLASVAFWSGSPGTR